MGRKLILVVEHEQATIEFLNKTLENQYQLLQIPLGERAVRIAENERFDLGIVSHCLPDMNGLDVLYLLGNFCPSLPVIFLAETAQKDVILSAFRNGAKDFLEKPIDKNELLKSINRIMVASQENHHNKQTCYLTTIPIKETSGLFIALFKKMQWKIFRKKSVAKPAPDIFDHSTHEKSINLSTDEQANEDQLKETENVPIVMEVNLLGKFSVLLDGKPILDWRGRKVQEVFAYLAFNHGRRISRDILMDKFWHHGTPDSVRNCLNVTLHKIRGLFQEVNPSREYIFFKDECYFIDPDIEFKLDVDEFLRHWRIAQSIEREKDIKAALTEYELATSLYEGDFMGENPYESWSDLDRENLKEIYLLILNKLSHYYSLDGKPATAINLCNTILEKDICREDVHRRLMKCYCRLGQRDKALKQFQKCAKILKSELEVNPARATIRLYEKIKQEN